MKVDELVEIASKVSEALGGEDVPREIILQMINGVLPEVIFNDMVTLKRAQGWVYGEEHDEDKKTSPTVVLYSGLPPKVRACFEATFAVVKSLVYYLTSDNPDEPVLPPGLQGTMTPKQKAKWEEDNDTTLPDSVLAEVEADKTEEKVLVPPSGFANQ